MVNLSKNFHFYASKYENFIVIGGFNPLQPGAADLYHLKTSENL